MPTLLIPTTEIVAAELIKTFDNVDPGQVATSVPDPAITDWSAAGFVQVASFGGTPSSSAALLRSAVSVDTWAYNRNSTRPPWGKANVLAMKIWAATWNRIYLDNRVVMRRLDLSDVAGKNFGQVLVLSAYALTEPARRTNDPANWAHYGFDLRVNWSVLTTP